MLENLKRDTTVENETDFLGGGVLDSALYDFVVNMAYFDTSKGGANSLNLELKAANGATMRTVLWITSGTAKGCKNYYEDKQGKRRYLPGFNQANAICMLGIEKEISNVVPEKKVIKVYDFDAKKEVPTEKDVIMELIGAQITCGVVKQVVDKNVKNAAGDYVPSGETREENEIDKCFRTADGMTVAELTSGETEPAFKAKWDEKNAGKVRMRAKGATAANAASASSPATAGAGAQTESLFK